MSRIAWWLVRIAAAIAILGVIAFGLIQWRQARKQAEWRAQTERRHALDLAMLRRRSQICIEGIGGRDPAADAASDVMRGDQTLIGIEIVPQEDGPYTLYPGVELCAPTRRPNARVGKWFTYGYYDDPLIGVPRYDAPCQMAADRYARAYNAEMVRRAPRAIAAFCHIERVRPQSNGD
jgi:hypothetical protein